MQVENLQKTRQKILNALASTTESSTIHGLPSITKNPYLAIKIMWIIFLALSTGYCSYSIYVCIMQYFSYQTVTQIDIRYETKMEFPIVKICHADIGVPYIDYIIPNIGTFLACQLFMRLLWKSYPDNYKSITGISSLSNTLVTCIYNMKPCNLTQDFQHYYDWSYGNCYMFNTGMNMLNQTTLKKNSFITGSSNGLQLELYIPSADMNNNFASNENGFVVLVSDEPMDSLINEGLRLPTGFSTNIIINKYKIELVPKPYSLCTPDLISEDSYRSPCFKTSFKSSLINRRSYNFLDCKSMCFQIFLAKTCACQANQNDPFYPNMRMCNYSDRHCTFPAYINFTASPSELEACDCPIECSRTDFSLETHFSEYPTLYYAKTLSAYNPVINSKFPNNTANYSNLKNSLAAVNIFYEQLQYVKITHQVKMIASDLLANIGGSLGLFLGMSLLTHAELTEIIIQSLIVFYKSRKKLTVKAIEQKNVPEIKVKTDPLANVTKIESSNQIKKE